MADGRPQFMCACNAEMLEAIWIEDTDEVELSIWRMGAGSPTGIRQRLRHIWRIIRWGHPYQDWIILRPEEQQHLIRFLEAGAPEPLDA